ncbi:hypothetical protein BDZ94DRAFT_1189779 [Collybia nuda]|uniref:Uncharacterized protein n=1 Tax=Collybia nuda TaxID=64659 RepID=A0A9P6CGF8_9AGAR|nr:hypothetical protein BDZ94DRAFT_1189779 [Collybia nuda]
MVATTNAAIMKAEKAERRNRDVEAQLEQQSKELRTLLNQLRQSEALRQQTLELLETKTSELRGAQAFMSKEDSLSGADVIGMVKSLNAEILQVAAFMADSLEDLGKIQTEDVEITPTKSAAGLGKYIIRALRFRQNRAEFDPMPVQIALQVCLIQACKRVVDGWVPGVPGHDLIFDRVYARVRDTEGQSISGRWRAMTRSQIRNMAGEDAHTSIMKIVTDEVFEVFRIAGYSTRDLKKNSYFDKFRERLDAIGRLTYRIQEAIGEGLTSEDFHMSVVGVGEGFDPEEMDDTFLQSGSAARGERVAGTTDFGLSIQASKKGSPPTILKKPKVVLASAL